MSLTSVGVAQPRIANTPPGFRIYDVDRREQNMRRLIGELAGTPALSHRRADAALGRLDDIERQERDLRSREHGRLTVPIIRTIDARLNALSRRLGLREPAVGAADAPVSSPIGAARDGSLRVSAPPSTASRAETAS
jgi:hypothetical protein